MSCVRVISKRTLREYYTNHAASEMPLADWYYKMLKTQAVNLHELRKMFNSVDAVGRYTIFNIGGNSFRLISSIHYSRQLCFVRAIWTHAEYDKKENRAKLNKGDL